MHTNRPTNNTELNPNLKAEILQILRQRFGDDIQINAHNVLSDEKRRNVLMRIQLKSTSGSTPASVIFKQSLPRKTDPDYNDAHARFSRDWAGLEFANSLDQSSHTVPKFFGGSKQQRFILIEDLGEKHVSLVDSLLVTNNSDHAIPALERYMRALGKFHANSFKHTDEYLKILRSINNDAKTPQDEFKMDFDHLTNGLNSANAALKMSITNACQKEIKEVMAGLFHPGPFTVLIHGDIAPDNVFDHKPPIGLQLIDFEIAAVRNALLDGTYLRMSMPTGWCAKSLPKDLIQSLENIYRAELEEKIAAAKDNQKYTTAYVQACAFWALQEMAHLDIKLHKDFSWGGDPNLPKHLVWESDNNSARSRLLSRLQAFIEVSTEHNMLPNIRKMAEAMLKEVRKLWPDAKPLDFYPAFNEKPELAFSTGNIAKQFGVSPEKFMPEKQTQASVKQEKSSLIQQNTLSHANQGNESIQTPLPTQVVPLRGKK